MALTADQLSLLRAELGDQTPPTDTDLDDIFDLRGGLVGVVRHVWSQRLATLLNQPSSFAVTGDYSQNTAVNITAIRQRLVELSGVSDDSDDIPPGGGPLMFKVIQLVRGGQDR